MDQELLEAAIDLHARGHLAEAEQLYCRVLLSNSRSTHARHMLGVLKAQQGLNREAYELLAPIVAKHPLDALVVENYANVLRALHRHEEALRYFDSVLALASGNARFWCNRANTLDEMGRSLEALADYDRALSLEPHFPLALNNRGSALMKLGHYQAARESFERALMIDPGYPVAHANRGDALLRLCRYSESLSSYRRALELDPDNIGAWCNHGVVLQELGRLDAAEQSFDHAWKLAPGAPEVRLNLARLYLLQEDFRRGLPLFEARKDLPEPWDARRFAQPLWTGVEEINGKTLFVYIQAGLGDAIQFYRYAALIQAQGARVILSVNDRLLPLLQSATPTVAMLGLEQVPERFDYHIPLMSLPLALGIAIPETGPYLTADPRRVSQWRARLGAGGYRVAVAWQGHIGEGAEGKSFPASAFAGIAAISGVRLISLQKNAGLEQLAHLPAAMTVETYPGLDDGPGAFLDSAAILQNCDLLISCDTGLAHLAGALGVPNWIALKHVPDWRWFLRRSDTPWYSKTRLFRQASPGDWDSVFRAMEAELASLQSRGSTRSWGERPKN
jgi:tetratricopeptide (TPR) repeat protein